MDYIWGRILYFENVVMAMVVVLFYYFYGYYYSWFFVWVSVGYLFVLRVLGGVFWRGEERKGERKKGRSFY